MVHVSLLPLSKTCRHCAVGYAPRSSGGRPSDYCSLQCRAASKAAIKRTEKAKRKAVLKGAKIERVDPFVVFERDGWRCQLCFDPTPKEKRGTHEDDAPELDHVVALADGGSHSYVNTQCACRRCNIEKGRRKDFVSAKIYALLG